MRKLSLLFILAITLIACEGPEGPPGVNIVAQSFEATINFQGPDYSAIVPYPADIEVFPDDMVLVYILWDQDTGLDGNPIDIWRLLPQVSYTDVGEFQYNYDHTNADARIFLDAPDLSTLDNLLPADLNNQIFRIVLLPNEMATDDLDITDYDAVMRQGGLDTNNIQVVN